MQGNTEKAKIFKGGGNFFTVHNQGGWFRQSNQSIEDTLYFHSDDELIPSINGVLGPRSFRNINSESVQKDFTPVVVHANKDDNLLDFLYSKPLTDWHQQRGNLINIPVLFPPVFGGKSTLHIPRERKPRHAFPLERLHEYWDPDKASINEIPINFYSCAIALKNKNIHFPFRYVNMGENYIQPISGTIAISNGITGSIAFAYDITSGKLISEFSLRCHAFKTPYLVSVTDYVVPIDLNQSQVYLYIFEN